MALAKEVVYVLVGVCTTDGLTKRVAEVRRVVLRHIGQPARWPGPRTGSSTMTGHQPDLVAAGAEWSAAAEMDAFETVMWRAEADPRLRSTLTLVEVLDQAPDADRLLRAHDWASRIVPRFRQRVVEPPLTLGAPAWVTEAELDFGYHLKHVHLPAPGTLSQVLEIAQSVAMRPFDLTRPLWEAVIIDGLEGGRAAYILKVHHCIADGIGGVQLLAMLHSRTREPMRDRPEPAAPPADTRTPLEILAAQATRQAAEAPGRAIRQSAVAGGLAAQALRSPARSVMDAIAFASSLRRVADPATGASSPLLRPRSLERRFEIAEVPLADLKAAAKSAGGSVNDAFVAAVLGGFRRYHEHFAYPSTRSRSRCRSACGPRRTRSAATGSLLHVSPLRSPSAIRRSACGKCGNS